MADVGVAVSATVRGELRLCEEQVRSEGMGDGDREVSSRRADVPTSQSGSTVSPTPKHCESPPVSWGLRKWEQSRFLEAVESNFRPALGSSWACRLQRLAFMESQCRK